MKNQPIDIQCVESILDIQYIEGISNERQTVITPVNSTISDLYRVVNSLNEPDKTADNTPPKIFPKEKTAPEEEENFYFHGQKFEVLLEKGKYDVVMLCQIDYRMFCLISMTGQVDIMCPRPGNRWSKPIRVKNNLFLSDNDITKMAGYRKWRLAKDQSWPNLEMVIDKQ